MRKTKKKNLIRRFRQYQELSQEELARMTGTYQVKISRYESGQIRKIPQAMKEAIARALGLAITVVFPTDTDRPVQGVGNEKSRGR